MRGHLPGGLDAILHEDCVFLSPIVFTPQQGREVTKLYLTAAAGTLGGDDGEVSTAVSGDGARGGFRYVKEVLQGNHAVLEFETMVDGRTVNGVDMIRFNDADRIVEFKVMVRPLKAMQVVHEKMAAMLQAGR